MIKVLLDQTESEIAQIDKRVSEIPLQNDSLRRRLKSALEERTQKEEKMAQYRAIMSPMLLLPPEILAIIFEYSMPSDPNQRLCHMYRVLCAVSSAWRHVALGHPALRMEVENVPEQLFDPIQRSFLRNNNRPSDTDRATIKVLLDQTAQIDERVEEILRQKYNLSRRLKSALEERTQKEEKIAQYRAIMSPVRLLPPEILAIIFEYSMPSDPSQRLGHMSHVLCTVSSAWRHAALGHPALWMEVFKYYQPKKRMRIKSPFFSFSSSGDGLPVFSFRFISCWYATTRSLASTIFRSFASYFPSLSELYLKEFYELEAFLYLPPNSLPLLRILSLECGVELFKEPHSTPREVTVFDGARSLCDLRLDLRQSFFELWNLEDALPWSQLTDIDAKTVSLPFFSRMMTNGSSLERVSLVMKDSRSGITPIPTATLPQLSKLSIALAHPTNVQHLLSNLHLPSLKKLEVGSMETGPPINLNPFLHHGTRFLTTVRDLALWRVVADDMDCFSELITVCTPVEVLRIHLCNGFSESPDELFGALHSLLTCATSSSPALKRLTLVLHMDNPVAAKSLIAQFGRLVGTWNGIEGRAESLRRGEYQINLFLVTPYCALRTIEVSAERLRVRFGVSNGMARVAFQAGPDSTFGSPVYVGISGVTECLH
ncbi:hypothetical protein H0H81_005183 [Sphagnurus paluster]|uniref:F-box domain-containing protein n=1 Tax=Sphagnurus paluster TaxID=117069 RepID=A0A9P7GSJ8_9AGAR|nr:hypothetical protein H0H81_005183 [Sphagnurus paluster]